MRWACLWLIKPSRNERKRILILAATPVSSSFAAPDLQGDEDLNDVRLSDLNKLDASKPLPDGIELTADALLQSRGDYPEIFNSDSQESDLHNIFLSEIDPVLKPLSDALNLRYEQRKEYPKTEAELRADLLASGIRLERLLDPWGMPFRARFSVKNEMDVLLLTSAGPDKTFDTEDDFRVLKIQWPYFRPNTEAIQKAVSDYHERTGGYLRDIEALKNELARLGVDLKFAKKDPWGHVYHFEFGVHQTKFTITVTSAGPDGRFDTEAAHSSDDFSLTTVGIDYFRDTNAQRHRCGA